LTSPRRDDADEREVPVWIAWMITTHLLDDDAHVHALIRCEGADDACQRLFIRARIGSKPQGSARVVFGHEHCPSMERATSERGDESREMAEVSSSSG
jgi:hypothetical protein